MKKLLFLCLLVLFFSTDVMAWYSIPFETNYNNDYPLGHGNSKSPVQPPLVYIEDYTLFFVVGHPDYELTIKDEDGEIVYIAGVISTETLVSLPSTLSGDYQIELKMGYWIFTGYISL